MNLSTAKKDATVPADTVALFLKYISLRTQFLQNFCQHTVTLIEAGNSIHDLVIGSMAAGFIQLHRQIGQFLGVGSIVSNHVLHQSQQLVHGCVAVVVLMTMLM